MNLYYKLSKFILFSFISIIIILCGLYFYAFLLPKLELKSANSFQLYDLEDNLITQGSSSKDWTKIDDISEHLIKATISIEDKNFYSHQGFDYLRIVKAMWVNIQNKNISQGASTISQQYVKNLFLEFDQTWSRKVKEAFLTMQLELNYDKDEILEGYLNTINYGQGNYGIKNASKYYFNKSPKDLTLEESLILAGIPKSPGKYNPVSNYEKAIKRAKLIARTMVTNKYLSEKEYQNLFTSSINIIQQKDENTSDMVLYYKDAVMEELKDLNVIPNSLIDSGGIKIYTNLDWNAQNSLFSAVRNDLKDETVEVASIIVNPKTGGVLALTGGKNYAISQFNRATQAKRQVGSSIKPFLYYSALENNFVSSSTFTSEKTTFALSSGKSYSPTNYKDNYANKPITMAAALALSDNIYAVKTNMFLGPETLVETLHKTGIEAKLQALPSLALGTCELTMLDYATGYTTLASGGYKKDLFFIRRVEDLEGNILYEHKYEEDLVLNPNYTYILNEMMTNTTNVNFIDYTQPSALSIADKLTHKYAIKTGTTGYDFYLAGYNPDILMLVWIGYDDGSSLELNKNIYTKNIFADTIEPILLNKEESWYEKPPNIIGIPKNAITGESSSTTSNSAIYYYVKGTENYVFQEN